MHIVWLSGKKAWRYSKYLTVHLIHLPESPDKIHARIHFIIISDFALFAVTHAPVAF